MAQGVTWSPEPSASHERLLFLAARDGVAARSRRWWHIAIRVAGGAHSALPSAADAAPRLRPEQELQSRSMHVGVLVVDQLASRFTAQERDLLRAEGALPAWFWAAFEEGVRVERRRP